MIQPQVSDNFDQRLKFMKSPTWMCFSEQRRLRGRRQRFFISCFRSERWRMLHDVDPHETACIIQEDWDKKLRERHIHRTVICGSITMVRDIDGQIDEHLTTDFVFREIKDMAEILTFGNDINAAQAAAIDALMKEERNDA